MNMNEKKCCVLSCQQTRADNITLHTFPNPLKELERFNKWIFAIGNNVLVLDPQAVFKYGRVCHSHFDTKYHTSSNRLSKIAVPSLNLSGTYNPAPVLQEVTNVVKETVTFRTSPCTSQQQQLPASTSKDVFSQGAHVQEMASVPKKTYLRTTQPAPPISEKAAAPGSKDMKNVVKLKSFDGNTIILKNKIKKLQQSKDSLSIRLKKALKLSENAAFQKALSKFSPIASIFINLQFREAGKHKMGYRFTNKEKIMALALYKQGPIAYRWLQHFFVLPFPLTLSRMISQASLQNIKPAHIRLSQ